MSKSKHKQLRRQKPVTASKTGRVRWGLAGVVVVVAVVAFAVFRPSPSPKLGADATPRDAEAGMASHFAPTVPNKTPAPTPAPEGMVWIPGGEFSMGSTVESEALCGLPGGTRDALPVHRIYVDGFWMDATEVTNEQFEKFAKVTGYVTIAERTPTKEEFPTAPP